jgi:YD repeat-containing protein
MEADVITARLVRAIVVMTCIYLICGDELRAQSPVTYIYDALGRLVGVVDGAGESAVYVYDAVGNLLSIERHGAGNVAIVQFNPSSGSIGSSITIYGTGFSTTPSSNTLTFNGVAATVTAATATQLTATVPTGATSGAIAVTTPSGSATSATSFTVATSAGPTISSVTPTIATPGTAVTITGTNFETTPSNNRVAFNRRHATISSSTATSIATQVPSLTGSGRISVTTPAGTVTGDDFFIPPPPRVASDVAFTGRWTLNQSATVSIGTANKAGLVVFDATAGRRIAVRGASGTFSNGTGCQMLAKVLNPDGVSLSQPVTCVESNGFTDALEVPATGTYTVYLDPSGSAAGSTSLTIYDFVDVTGTIALGGSPVTVTTTTPGQNGILTFTGTASQRVSIRGTNGMSGQIGITCDVDTVLRKPDGTTLASGCMEGSGFIEPVTLPTTGTYSILVNPASTATGSLTVTLYDVPADVSGSITAGGSAVTVTTTTPGQNGVLTFSGTANQRISLRGTNGVSGQIGLTCDIDATIRNPDGSTLATSCMEGSGYIDATTLPTTGAYSILINPASTVTGSLTLTLYDVPADVSGSITAGGSAVTVTTTTPGQNGVLTFSGTANQRISLRGTNGVSGQIGLTCDIDATIRKPDGSTLATSCMEGSGYIDLTILPTTGTYSILVNPTTFVTGSLTLTLYDVPADVSGSLTVNGSAAGATITTPGQNGALTFSGTQSQQLTVHVTNNTMGSVTITLQKPDGSTLTQSSSSAGSFNLSTQTLPVTGTYTVSINPSQWNTGSMNVSVTSP